VCEFMFDSVVMEGGGRGVGDCILISVGFLRILFGF